ncbi:MAG TPA: hypothetical protein VFW45_10455 [Candidatus Polarisedimenticolia bacterium]|nr:hypothetical protein [Candidatus Polarisedimenticolia bacterium]
MRCLMVIVSLPLLLGASSCTRDHGAAGVGLGLDSTCGAICDELGGAWSVTVTPASTMTTSCSNPRADRTAVTFPTEAIGLGEMSIRQTPGRSQIEFRTASAPERISGSLDPTSLGITFVLMDGQGNAIRCTGTLQKFANPAGSQGWSARTTCDSSLVGTVECRLDPPVNAALTVQTILMEAPPT